MVTNEGGAAMKKSLWGACSILLLSGVVLAQEAGKLGFRPGKELDLVLTEAKTTGKPVLVFMHQPN
jgi:hypothetical protein